MKLRIIVVGFGNFGKFLGQEFERQGHSVLGLDSRQRISKDLPPADIVLFSPSILSFREVLGAFPVDSFKTSLFVDVCSVKEATKRLFLEALPTTADILCCHPMFGPGTARNSWDGHRFMWETVRSNNEERTDSFLHIFRNAGCAMISMSCSEHDILAAKTQFLTHLVSRVLQETGLPQTQVDTRSYETLRKLSEMLCKNSDDLFVGLYRENPHAQEIAKRFLKAANKIVSKL